jgi:hypothetical protein
MSENEKPAPNMIVEKELARCDQILECMRRIKELSPEW